MSGSTQLKVKVIPGASSSKIVGWLGDELKIRVAAPPEKGRANRMVKELIAEVLGLNPREVRISSGETSARKTLTLDRMTETELQKRLETL